MTRHYRLSVHDLNGKKLCDLYDSRVEQVGAAKSIKITKEIEGWKEVEFALSKRDSEENRNFRFDFIRNENLLYLYENNELDIYCIKTPAGAHDASKVQLSVTCNHLSEELKTKNLYKYFDDVNGIDTCENLIRKAIAGTGWTLIICDKFFEADGTTEKIRSYSCDTKTGAWNMIAEICKLFNAHPIFHGANRTIEIRANDSSAGWKEVLYGKNSDKIVRTPDSSNLVTRLYVEGEYGDYGYVGIDDVNPTGLPFLLNFSYYKELGVFTSEHQAIVDKYLVDYKESSSSISQRTTDLLAYTATLSGMIGVCEYALFPIEGGAPNKDNAIYSKNIKSEDKNLKAGDNVAIVFSGGSYEYVEYSDNVSLDGVICILKFIPTITGSMAAYEDLISSSNDSVSKYLEELNEFLEDEGYAAVSVSELHSVYGVEDLKSVKDEGFNTNGLPVQYTLNTTLEYTHSIGLSENVIKTSSVALAAEMLKLIALVQDINSANRDIAFASEGQEKIENDFCIAMGIMLRDGYWSDDNYTVGQEETLYRDSLKMSEIVGRPTFTYSVDTFNLSVLPEYADERFELGDTVRIYDTELEINDYTIVSKTVEHPDKPTSDTATFKSDLLDIGTKSFSTMLERVTELAEQVRQNKDIYRRAVAISKDGTIDSSVLSGAIDVLKTKLLSSSSNWTTDDKGNMIFTALDGSSAMMLCGNGFMVANSKKNNGEWDWRTFGTGEGFTADLIVAGFINAERIQSHSITVDHLASNVGESLDLSSNESVRIAVENASLNIGKEAIVATVRESEEYKSDLSSVTMTKDKFEAFVENSTSVSSIKSQADKISLIVEGEDSEGKLILSDELIEVMVDQINLLADEIITIAVKSKTEIYRGEYPPVGAALNSLWIQGSTNYTFQRVDDYDKLPSFWLDEFGVLYYTYDDNSVIYNMHIDDNGVLYIDSRAPFMVVIGEDGTFEPWIRVKDQDLSAAELKITDDSIIQTVTNSKIYQDLTSRMISAEQKITAEAIVATVCLSDTYKDDVGNLKERMDNAEQKIADNAIISTVTQSTKYKDDIKSALDATETVQENLEGQIDVVWSEVEQTVNHFEVELGQKVGKDELTTYMRYENGELELGRSGSRYTTQTSDNGFKVLQDGVTMTSIMQNTVSAPIINAQRMFTIGEHNIRLGTSGHLIFN